jgi:hypothetical protein
VDTVSSEPDQIAASLLKLLNSHGHGFQYAVVRRLDQLYSEGKSRWFIDGVEFPVTVGDQTTHIDFILKSKTGRTYIVAECKRADPAKARWCFVRAPYTSRNPRPTEVLFEQVSCNELGLVTRRAIRAYAKEDGYHLGFELRTGRKGNGESQQGRTINEAVSQVLRGTSGLINHLQDAAPGQPKTTHLIRFIPVIITTARIFITKADLGEANLKTGNLSPEALMVEPCDAIWFTHNRSPALKPNAPSTTGSSDFNQFSSSLRNEFSRSVAIISADGLDSFMSWNLEEWLWSWDGGSS